MANIVPTPKIFSKSLDLSQVFGLQDGCYQLFTSQNTKRLVRVSPRPGYLVPKFPAEQFDVSEDPVPYLTAFINDRCLHLDFVCVAIDRLELKKVEVCMADFCLTESEMIETASLNGVRVVWSLETGEMLTLE